MRKKQSKIAFSSYSAACVCCWASLISRSQLAPRNAKGHLVELQKRKKMKMTSHQPFTTGQRFDTRTCFCRRKTLSSQTIVKVNGSAFMGPHFARLGRGRLLRSVALKTACFSPSSGPAYTNTYYPVQHRCIFKKSTVSRLLTDVIIYYSTGRQSVDGPSKIRLNILFEIIRQSYRNVLVH